MYRRAVPCQYQRRHNNPSIYPSAKQQSLTPMARLKGARRPIPLTEASPRKPDAMAASPVPQVAMRKVSARKWDGYPRLWCSVTIQDSNAVTSTVELAPGKQRQAEPVGEN